MLRLNRLIRIFAAGGMLPLLMLPSSAVWAADSYRWFHVTIETPWAIFIFLLPMVLTPLVLMVILYWRFALRPGDKNAGRGRGAKKSESTSSTPN